MKKIAFYAATALVFLSFSAHAQSTSVATVSIQRLMKESAAAKSVREQLEKKSKSFQADVGKKEEQLQKEDQELGKQKAVLSKDAFENKVKSFRDKVTEVQKEVQSKKAMLDNGSARAWETIQKSVLTIVADIAKEKAYGMVLAAEGPTSQVLYADGKLDITDETLKRLNEALPKVDVHFELPEKKK